LPQQPSIKEEMNTFSQYITETKNCPAGTKYCNKCGSCVAKTCEEKAALKEAAAMGESTVVHKMGGVVMGKTKTVDGKDTVKVDDAPVSKSTYDFMQKKGMNKVDSSGKPTADTTYGERKAAGLKTVKKVEEALADAGMNPADAQKQQQLQRKQLMLNRQKLQLQMKAVSKKKQTDMVMQSEDAAWTKKEGQNKEGGLNEKGRKSYEAQNPGSDLKAPQPKGGPRKRSFCARMSGMKRKLTSKKTANDPDSRINKSLRVWNC
jgi:hypothetical protein